MGGESWYTTKDLKAPFPDLKGGHVDYLLIYIYTKILFYWNIFLNLTYSCQCGNCQVMPMN